MPSKRAITIGDAIKRARIRLNLTADAAAAACNVSRSRFYQWENEKRVFPKNLRVLSETLGIPLKRLEALNRSQRRVQN